MLAENEGLSDHKIHHGSGALAALASNSLDGSHSTTSSTHSAEDSKSPVVSSFPSCSLPMNISSTNSLKAQASSEQLIKSPHSGSGRLSFLGCFSSGGKSRVLGDDEAPPSFLSSCEVGIRPSFYWVDTQQATEEQRLEAEASFRFMKADCQDEAVVIDNFAGILGLTFVGVFDGHGPNGRAAAKFVSSRLPDVLAEKMSALKSKSERKKLDAMKEACHQVDIAMQNYKKCGFDASLSGTTACFAMVSGSRVLLANVGDSRCVLARKTASFQQLNINSNNTNTSNNNNNNSTSSGVEAIAMTSDAKPELPEENNRIVMAGGIVQQLLDESGNRCGAHRVFRRGDNVLPGLAMSRSLGDIYAHSVGVTWMPVVTAFSLTPKDLFLVLATDGLWDVMDNTTTVDFIHRYRQQRDAGVSCAEALTLEAQERWKALHNEALVDDISVAILHTAPLPPPERTASLPRALTRAASCNDEANQIWSKWKDGDASAESADPSSHAPRRYFEHLYGTDASNDHAGTSVDTTTSTLFRGPLSPPTSLLSSPSPPAMATSGGASSISRQGSTSLVAAVEEEEEGVDKVHVDKRGGGGLGGEHPSIEIEEERHHIVMLTRRGSGADIPGRIGGSGVQKGSMHVIVHRHLDDDVDVDDDSLLLDAMKNMDILDDDGRSLSPLHHHSIHQNTASSLLVHGQSMPSTSSDGNNNNNNNNNISAGRGPGNPLAFGTDTLDAPLTGHIPDATKSATVQAEASVPLRRHSSSKPIPVGSSTSQKHSGGAPPMDDDAVTDIATNTATTTTTNTRGGGGSSSIHLRDGMDAVSPMTQGGLSTSAYHQPSSMFRPIRKAYPSTATMNSVPSWDGGFHQSFKSETSLQGLGNVPTSNGNDTPRSSESASSLPFDGGALALGTTPPMTGGGMSHAHHHHHRHGNTGVGAHTASPVVYHGGAMSSSYGMVRQRAPPRGELHHEGKVHRGIPRSLSSAGLLSHGRMSTDSEVSYGGSSRYGSLEDSILTMSPRQGLARSLSDAHQQHQHMVGAGGHGGSYSNMNYYSGSGNGNRVGDRSGIGYGTSLPILGAESPMTAAATRGAGECMVPSQLIRSGSSGRSVGGLQEAVQGMPSPGIAKA